MDFAVLFLYLPEAFLVMYRHRPVEMSLLPNKCHRCLRYSV